MGRLWVALGPLRVALGCAAVASFVATLSVLLFRMNLPFRANLLGAGAALLAWVATAVPLAERGQTMSRSLNFGLGLLNFIAGIAALVLGILGVIQFARCGFCSPWGGGAG